MSDNSYYQEWYKQNGETLNAQRRDRYASDPEYRARVQGRNEAARAKKRQAAEREMRRARKAIKIGAGGSWKTISIEVDGVVTPMFTLGAVAKATGKSISTLRVWERNGTIPETPHRSRTGDRLYTLDQIEEIKRCLDAHGKYDPMLQKVKKSPAYVIKEVYFSSIGQSVEMRLYKVGTLAKALGRTVASVTQLERRGAIPRTPLIATDFQYRLYSLDMIEVVQKAFSKRAPVIRGRFERQSLFNEIEDGWEDLGVTEARLVQ